jgi:hypothetical protein
VIVHQVDVESVPVFEAENNPPVARNRNAPYIFQATLETVEPITRQIKIGWTLRAIQVCQYIRDSLPLIRANLARVACLVQALKPRCRIVLITRVAYPVPVRVSTHKNQLPRGFSPLQIPMRLGRIRQLVHMVHAKGQLLRGDPVE